MLFATTNALIDHPGAFLNAPLNSARRRAACRNTNTSLKTF